MYAVLMTRRRDLHTRKASSTCRVSEVHTRSGCSVNSPPPRPLLLPRGVCGVFLWSARPAEGTRWGRWAGVSKAIRDGRRVITLDVTLMVLWGSYQLGYGVADQVGAGPGRMDTISVALPRRIIFSLPPSCARCPCSVRVSHSLRRTRP